MTCYSWLQPVTGSKSVHLPGCEPEDRLDIDSDLVDALLPVPKYIHGSRPLEELVKPLKTARGGQILRSSPPAAAQLAMHADSAEFASILNRN